MSLTETPGRRGNIKGVSLKNYTRQPKTAASTGWLYYDVEYGFDPGGYDGVARVTTKGGTMSPDDSNLNVSGAEEILIAIRVLPQKDGSVSQRDSLQEELGRLPAGYAELLKPHAKEHGEMLRRVGLDLGCDEQWAAASTEQFIETSKEQGVTPLFLETIHAMGRYLLISSCGKYPSPLQGIWPGNWSPPWKGRFCPGFERKPPDLGGRHGQSSRVREILLQLH